MWKVGGWSHGAVAYKLYHQNTILGAVSQSGGVPTGAVIERGSNGNGEYVRYADGTQICWGTQATSGGHTTASGSLFISSTVTHTFPAAFAGATPTVGVTGSNSVTIWGAVDVTGLTAFDMRTYRSGSSATDYTTRWMAIGRWF